MIRSIRDVALLFGVAAIVSHIARGPSGFLYFVAGLVASALVCARVVVAFRRGGGR